MIDRPICRGPKSCATLRSDSGTALMLALGYVIVITMFVSAFVAALNRGIERRAKERYIQASSSLAEAGVDKAIAALRQGGYAGEEKTPLGAGWFSVTVTPGLERGAYRIDALGALGGGEVTRGYVRIGADIVIDGARHSRTLRWEQRYLRTGS